MFGTYRPEDVTILLKDITGMVEPLGTKERERLIQQGRHYSEMLPLEYEPSPAYLAAYEDSLRRFARKTAQAVQSAAEQIWLRKKGRPVLVSLARAGTSIGILIKHALKRQHEADVPHYTISIIRGRGIDKNAMEYLLSRHKAEELQFVDGWTGKGAIQRTLANALQEFPGVDAGLAVAADPAGVAAICGTREDILIASSCLNATVSGLLSRTFLREDIIGAKDFHGAMFYRELLDRDMTYGFIEAIERAFSGNVPAHPPSACGNGLEEAQEIAERFGIADINLVKPGIGEATRVLLRRLPWKVLVHSRRDEENLGHIYQLAKEKEVEVLEYPLRHYRACGLIQSLADQ